MAKRMILVLFVTVLLLGTLGFMKFRQVKSAIAHASFQPPPDAVTSVVVGQAHWPSTMSVIGTMEAVQGVMVSADLPGTVAKINFDSGKAVREGDVLVELDTQQERAQLASLEAQRDLAKVNYARMQQLVNEGVISRAEYDQATAQQRATEANVAEIRATIARKTIRAPFSGVLGIRKVNLGQYLAGGNPHRSAAKAESNLCKRWHSPTGRWPSASRTHPKDHHGRLGGQSIHGTGQRD